MKLRLGVIGLSELWEKRYLPALRVLEDRFTLKALYEPVVRRAALAAREVDVAIHESFRVLCNRADIDAVLVLNPQWLGPLPILAACEAGKAVYLGSRVLLTLDEVARIRDAIKKSGVAGVVEFSRRYAPATIRLKELIATRLGPPRLLFCHRRLSHHIKMNGGCFCGQQSRLTLDLTELIDWCRFVVGKPPTGVMGVVHRSEGPQAIDYFMLTVTFGEPASSASLPIAQIGCGQYLPTHWVEAINYRPLAELQVVCERGVAFVDLPTALVWFDEAGRQQEVLDSERPLGERLLLHFYRAATSLVQRMEDIEDLYQTLRVIHLAEESFSSGKRLLVDQSG